jgi:Bacterial Ig domain
MGLVVSPPASALALPTTLSLPFAESFTGPTLDNPDWVLSGSAALTGTAESQGWLRLTTESSYQVGSAILNAPISTAGELVVDFDYDIPGAADGLSMFFLNGSTAEPTAGASGQALGYAAAGDMPGASNGYVSVGLSESFTDVRVVGSGNDLAGYNTIASTSDLPFSIGSYGGLRHVHVALVDGKLTADIEGDGLTTRVFDHVNIEDAVGQAALPLTVKLGFAASTGTQSSDHKIRNVAVRANTGDLRVVPSATRNASTGALTLSASLTNVATGGTVSDVQLAIAAHGVSLSDTWTCSTTGTATCPNTGTGVIGGISLPSGASTAKVTTTGTLSDSGSATFTVTSSANPLDSWTESLNLNGFPEAWPNSEGGIVAGKNSSGSSIPMWLNRSGLTFSALRALHGTVTASGSNLIYVPTTGYTGPDTITYAATDGRLTSVGMTFDLTVSTRADKALAMDIKSYSYDDDGDTYADTYVRLHNNGVETLELDSIVLATNADRTFSCYYGTWRCGTTEDGLTFTGGMLASGETVEFNLYSTLLMPDTPISVSATVAASGLATQTKTLNLTFPSATIQPVATPNNAPVVVPFTLSDPENDEVYVSDWWTPNGSVSLMGSTLVYYPPTGMLPDATDTARIYLSVTDGTTSGEVIVPVTLTAAIPNPPNAAPTAVHRVDYIDPVYEGGWFPKFVAAGPSSSYSLNAWDYEEDPTTLVSVTAVHGEATIRPDSGNQWIDYTPPDGFTGWDRITYTFTDGLHEPVSQTISVGVRVQMLDDYFVDTDRFDNVSPTAAVDTTSVVQNGARLIPVSFSDVDGDVVTLTSASAEHGTVTASGSTLTYTSEQGYVGDDTITYTFADGKTGETLAVTPLTVVVNTAPVPPSSAPMSMIEGKAGDEISFEITGFTDANNDPLTVSLTSEPQHGSVVFESPNTPQRAGLRASTSVGANGVRVVYTPFAGFSGADTFSYTVSDGNGGSYTQAVTVNVLAATSTPRLALLKTLPVAARLLDTRSAGGLVTETRVTVNSPQDGAALNVTVVGQEAPGFVTVWPCDKPRPNTSNVNFGVGTVVPNAVNITPAGTVCLYSSTPANLIVDQSGSWSKDGGFVGQTPDRMIDTRNKASKVTTVEVPGFDVSKATFVNITVIDPKDAGYVTVWPCASPKPDSSNVNFQAGETRAAAALVKPAANGKICMYSSTPAHLLMDRTGSLPAERVDTSHAGRLLDTRNQAARMKAGVTNLLPASNSIRYVNVTAVDTTGAGFATIYGDKSPKPTTSNVNYGTNTPSSNTTAIGAGNGITSYASTDWRVIVDLQAEIN